MILRDYQIEVLNHLKTSLKQGAKSPLLVLPTGAVKQLYFLSLQKTLLLKIRMFLSLFTEESL